MFVLILLFLLLGQAPAFVNAWFNEINNASNIGCSGHCASIQTAVFRNAIVISGATTNLSYSTNGGFTSPQSINANVTNLVYPGSSRYGQIMDSFIPSIGPYANRELLLIAGGSDSLNYYVDTWIATGLSASSFQASNCGSTPTFLNCSGSHRGRVFYGSSVRLGDRLYVVGGRLPSSTFRVHNDVWVTSTGTAWQQVPVSGPWPSPRETAAVAADSSGTSIVLVGGFDGFNFFDDVWISNSQVTAWRLVSATAPFSGRNAAALISSQGYLYLLSGSNSPTTFASDNWLSADDGQSWMAITLAAEYWSDSPTTLGQAVLWGRSIVIVADTSVWQGYTS